MDCKSKQGFARWRNNIIVTIFAVGLVVFVAHTVSAENGESYLVVNPTLELDEIIAKFEANKILEGLEMNATLLEFERRLREAKSRGETRWDSEKWMKDTEYYQALETYKLAEECFDRSIFVNEMEIYDHNEFGFASLKIMHNGFAELFKRQDMWKGILHVYEYLGAKLNPQEKREEYFRAGSNLGALRHLYELPEFKEQVKGREKLFLDANISVLKQFKSFLEWFEDNNVKDTMPFFTEPCQIARTALMLYKQVDPQEYAKVAPGIKSIRWPKEQYRKDVINFLDLVIRNVI